MNIRPTVVALVAVLATSAAFAAVPEHKPVEPQAPSAKAQTLLDELMAGMREVLRAVTPEVSLPKIELKLPPVAAR